MIEKCFKTQELKALGIVTGNFLAHPDTSYPYAIFENETTIIRDYPIDKGAGVVLQSVTLQSEVLQGVAQNCALGNRVLQLHSAVLRFRDTYCQAGSNHVKLIRGFISGSFLVTYRLDRPPQAGLSSRAIIFLEEICEKC